MFVSNIELEINKTIYLPGDQVPEELVTKRMQELNMVRKLHEKQTIVEELDVVQKETAKDKRAKKKKEAKLEQLNDQSSSVSVETTETTETFTDSEYNEAHDINDK